MSAFRSTLTAWTLVLAMAWTGVFSASGFCSSRIEKHPGGVLPTAAYRTRQVPLQGLIPSLGNSPLLTTTAPNAPFYAYDFMARLCRKQVDAAHPSLGHHLTPRAIIYGYDGLHHPASEPKQLTGTGMDFADAKPEGQRHRRAVSSQTIAASPGSMGVFSVASYAYDQVSNRISRTSSIAGVVNQSLAFNNNDQIDGSGYAYDDNGSTTQGPDGSADVYSFDNMLIRRVNSGSGLTVDMVYSATGDRVQKVTNGVAVNYLVDTNNHTGYAQVLEETDAAGNLEAVMVYGHDLISQDRTDGQGGFEMSFYSYDGLGSVRGLTDSIGTSLGQYHYDAYGTKIEDTVSVANPYLFAGERFDNDLGLYYLRARYLDVETGRFWTLDDFEGFGGSDPQSLHKYLYAHANPISNVDYSGNFSLQETTLAQRIGIGFVLGGIGGGVIGVVDARLRGDSWDQAAVAGLWGAGIGATVGALTPILGPLAVKYPSLIPWIKALGVGGTASGAFWTYDALINEDNIPLAVWRAVTSFVSLRMIAKGLNAGRPSGPQSPTPISPGKPGGPKPAKNFNPPTNQPQMPPSNLPPGYKVLRQKPTQQYPNGNWKILKDMGDGGKGQRINPSTMKPGPHPDTHVEFPDGYTGPYDY